VRISRTLNCRDKSLARHPGTKTAQPGMIAQRAAPLLACHRLAVAIDMFHLITGSAAQNVACQTKKPAHVIKNLAS